MVEKAVVERLEAVPAVTALLSTRIYPLRVPQSGTFPAATYQRIGRAEAALSGADAGVVQARVQLTSWAGTYAAAKAVSAAIRGALKRWRGTAASIVIQDIFLDGENELYEEDTGLYGVAQDYLVWYEEA